MTSERNDAEAQGSDYQLPALLAELADVAGLAAALAIAQVKGGGRAHFPARCRDDHWLVATVGREAADKICKHLRVNHKGGVTELVPLGPTKLYDRARFAALSMSDAGRSIADIARELGVSTRGIEQWRAAERRRKAIRRVGRPKMDEDGVVSLTRVYAPVQHGLMRGLSGTVAAIHAALPTDAPSTSDAPALPAVDIETLPQLLADIARVAGLGACAVIGRMKGSRVLHITNHRGRGGELTALVGPVSAGKLKAFFEARHGGDIELLVPKLLPDFFLDVAAWCEAARGAGHKSTDIAEWLGITPAVVDHICTYMSPSKTGKFQFVGGFPYSSGDEG